MTEFTFLLFGSPSLISAGKPIQLDTRKAIALLAYLVVNGRPLRRDTLAGVLWPDYSQVNARAALRRTLSTLNKALDEQFLLIQRDEIGLQANDKLWVDVVEFYRCLAAPPGHDRIPMLEKAVDLYRGDFMEGFSLRDSLEFDDWQYRTGESLRQELAQALDELADDCIKKRKFEIGLGWMQRRLKIDPLHEDAHRRLMRLYTWAGKRNEALRQYHDCERILREELGVYPLEETQTLYRQIMDDLLPAPLPDAESSSFSVQATVTGETIQPVGRTLVGRKVEWELLHQAYQASLSKGFLVGIQGEAGIGKTTLVEDFLSSLGQNNVRVVSVRCYNGEDRLVYNPLIEALRTGLRLPESVPCLQGLEDHWLAESARLLPELNTLTPVIPQAAPLDGPGAQNRFYEGIRQTLKALLCHQNGGVVFFDDLHWADTATLDWLKYLTRRLQDFPALILVTWRNDGQTTDVLRQWSTELVRNGTGQLITLQPLDLGEVSALAKAEGFEADRLPDDFVTRLHAESEGNPFFVIEYLNTIQAQGVEVDWAIPASVRDLLRSRLIGVDETGQQLLGAAAVIGRSFEFDVVHHTSGRSEDETVTGLEKLVSQGLLIEKEAPLTDIGNEFDFSHQKVRSLVYEDLSQPRRRLLHRRVAEALITLPRIRRNPRQAASRIGYHYARAGLEEMAAEYYFQAGEYAFGLYANNEAWEHFQNALQMGYPTCVRSPKNLEIWQLWLANTMMLLNIT
jgi:DNA-binding SARP family transcriptional activator